MRSLTAEIWETSVCALEGSIFISSCDSLISLVCNTSVRAFRLLRVVREVVMNGCVKDRVIIGGGIWEGELATSPPSFTVIGNTLESRSSTKSNTSKKLDLT